MANEEFYINDREIKDWADLNYSYKEIDVLIERYPQLSCIADDLYSSYKLIENSYKIGGKLLIAGNGGSAADVRPRIFNYSTSYVNPYVSMEYYAYHLKISL